MEHFALGIDIGGTNTVFGIVNKQGEVIYENSLSTKNFVDAHLLMAAIYKDLHSHDFVTTLLGIGIGAPNGNAKTGQIEFAPNLDWKGIVPICEITEAIFHRPAILINDANAAALGEYMFGTAKGVDHFVTITLGTGLGSGIIVDGHLVEGQHGFAGEFGHIRVVHNGRMCGCSRKGCLETYASSTGVVRTYNEQKYTFLSNDNKLHPAKEIFQLAEEGNEEALKIVNFTAEILGNALADFACFSDPKLFVLFGGIAQSGAFFADKVKIHMENNLLEVLKGKIDIQTSGLHQKNAAVLGTAASIFWKTINRPI